MVIYEKKIFNNENILIAANEFITNDQTSKIYHKNIM